MPFLPNYSWEFLTEDEIEHRSLRAMRNHIDYIKKHSVYYEKTLSSIRGDDVKGIEDIQSLPFTDKSDLSAQTSDFYCTEDIAEFCVTSGSTGKPLIVPLTKNDLDRLSFNESMSFNAVGIGPEDRTQIMLSLDRLFVAGMAYYRGMIALGANTARIGVLPMEMQEYYIRLLQPSVLVGVPSYFIKLGEAIKAGARLTEKSSIKRLICIGEPLRNADMSWNSTAEKLQDLYGAQVYSTYASTEICSSYCDCVQRTGGHSHPELIYTEIIDEAGRPCPDGEVGELVVSTFGMEGMPLLRYRTGDMTFKVKGKCPCGRNSMRIGPIVYRKSQLIKLKGTTLYPATVSSVLDSMNVCEDYILELKGRLNDDNASELILHAVSDKKNLHNISTAVYAATRVRIPVFLTNKGTVSAMRKESRKAIRFVDNRR